MFSEDKLMAVLRKKDEISWLQEAALTMRVKLDKQPDDLGPQSDKTALRILAVLEQQLKELESGTAAR